MIRKALMIMFTSLLLVGMPPVQAATQDSAKSVTLYRSPQCGCCVGYAGYLRQNGFAVTVKSTEDLAQMNLLAGIPENYQGCHLSLVDGYTVSGHVPVNTLNKLLSEKPDIKGITLPGMPMGSPGMSGTKSVPFTMYEIGGENPQIYATE